MFSIQYCSTASSAANVRPTLTEGSCQTNEGAHQTNCLRNSRSGAFSLSRVKTISKYPFEFSLHADASTDTTALHVRSSVGGITAENSTSLSVKTGRQRFSPMACLTPISPMIVAKTDAQTRFASIVSSTNAGTSESGRCRAGDRWVARLLRRSTGKDEAHRVEKEAHGDRGEEAGEAEAEPVDRGEPAYDICREAACIGARGCRAASETLRHIEQGQTKPEADVGWPDQAQIEAANPKDVGVVAEQAEPEPRIDRHDQPDHAAHRRNDGG